jgi:hypothetical protein
MKALDLLFGLLGYLIKLVSPQIFYFADCPNYVPDYIEPDCQAFEGGRIVAMAFIDEDVVFDDTNDITDPANWTGLAYENDIIIYQKTNGSMSPASPVTVEGKGAQAEKSVGRDHVVSVRVPGIKGNDGHWNALNRSTNYNFAFVTGKDYDILHYVNAIVDINAGEDIPSPLSSEIDWVATVAWSDNDLPSTSDVPVGIFS